VTLNFELAFLSGPDPLKVPFFVSLFQDAIFKGQNAPLINAIEKQQRQMEIDQAVKLALEQKIRETAKPEETVIITPPETVEKVVQYPPLLIAGIGIIVFIIILRRRA